MKRENPSDVFEWQVLPFGMVGSPCCATFTLQRHVRDHGGPGRVVRYTVHTLNEAKVLVDRLREILASGGLEIRQVGLQHT